jgi:polyribonucleotide nucleotidyltransferase
MGITKEAKPGEVYTGKINRIESFGAFVEILPNKDGLLHISQWSNERINRMEDVCSLGDEITVQILEVGDDGKIRLSRRAMLEDRDAGDSSSRSSNREPISNPADGGAPKPSSDDDGPRVRFRPKR